MPSDGPDDWLATIAGALDSLPESDAEQFVYRMQYGSMKLGLYAPRREDPQQPHKRDELYLVWQGTGSFVREHETRRFGPGDVIFVPAGMVHRFEDFTEDFKAWVVFYGPQGGETGLDPARYTDD